MSVVSFGFLLDGTALRAIDVEIIADQCRMENILITTSKKKRAGLLLNNALRRSPHLSAFSFHLGSKIVPHLIYRLRRQSPSSPAPPASSELKTCPPLCRSERAFRCVGPSLGEQQTQ